MHCILRVVILRLVSDDLVFDDGQACLVTGMASEAPSISAEDIPVGLNTIKLPDVAPMGDAMLILGNCLVSSRKSDLVRRIQAVPIATRITAEHLEKGSADIDVGVFAFARIQVLDEDGRPAQDRPTIGVVDDATLEGQVSPEGYADFLLRPGQKMTYLFDQPAKPTLFDIPHDREDAGTITLHRRLI